MIRKGLTVIEVLVALLLSSITVSIGVGVWSALGSVGDRSSSDIDATAIQRAATLRHHLPSGGLSDSSGLAGTPLRFAFPSHCLSASGWREACVVDIRIDGAEGEASLSVREGTRDAALILGPAAELRLVYLGTDDVGALRWLPAWEPTRSVPRAVAAIVDSDTIVLVTTVMP
jgi:prepilin-type N-terminal cleavage/methylation domain-containing protein